MELDNIYFSGERGPTGRFENREPTPDQVVVQISYEDDQGHRYVDRFPLDVRLIWSRTYTASSKSPDAHRERLVEAVEAIQKRLGG